MKFSRPIRDTVIGTLLHCLSRVTDDVICLSDDLFHDANKVKTIVDQKTEHLQSVMEKLEKMVVCSDGCTVQIKPTIHSSV